MVTVLSGLSGRFFLIYIPLCKSDKQPSAAHRPIVGSPAAIVAVTGIRIGHAPVGVWHRCADALCGAERELQVVTPGHKAVRNNIGNESCVILVVSVAASLCRGSRAAFCGCNNVLESMSSNCWSA